MVYGFLESLYFVNFRTMTKQKQLNSCWLILKVMHNKTNYVEESSKSNNTSLVLYLKAETQTLSKSNQPIWYN